MQCSAFAACESCCVPIPTRAHPHVAWDTQVASALKAFNPEVLVLFYRHAQIDFGDCYASGAVFEANPSWWLVDDSGAPFGDPHRHYFDTTQAAVQDFLAVAAVNVTDAASLLDGVFADGSSDTTLPNFNASRFQSYTASRHASLGAVTQAVPCPTSTRRGSRRTPPAGTRPWVR